MLLLLMVWVFGVLCGFAAGVVFMETESWVAEVDETSCDCPTCRKLGEDW